MLDLDLQNNSTNQSSLCGKRITNEKPGNFAGSTKGENRAENYKVPTVNIEIKGLGL